MGVRRPSCPDQLTVAKVISTSTLKCSANMAFRAIPALIIFNKGQPVSTKIGSLPKSKLVELCEKSP
jgi:thioredoxin-like negative regulator of GroEL